MPTVLRAAGLRFFFFSNERREPPHIHVEQAEKLAKFWLTPPSLASNVGFRSGELTTLLRLVEENRVALLEHWNEHFGNQG